jgi:hypothetical protein
MHTDGTAVDLPCCSLPACFRASWLELHCRHLAASAQMTAEVEAVRVELAHASMRSMLLGKAVLLLVLCMLLWQVLQLWQGLAWSWEMAVA